MAKAKSSKASREVEKPDGGCILVKGEVDRIGILLEQIAGCVQLLDARLHEQNKLEDDAGAMTALEVIKERAEEASRILNGGWGRFTPEVVRLREENIKRLAAARQEQDEHVRKLEERGEKMRKALDRVE